VQLPYCWEIVSDPFREGRYRATKLERSSYDVQVGPITSTNPNCVSFKIGGRQYIRCT
jgi:hypothetical protein